jgi:hypothetical protein
MCRTRNENTAEDFAGSSFISKGIFRWFCRGIVNGVTVPVVTDSNKSYVSHCCYVCAVYKPRDLYVWGQESLDVRGVLGYHLYLLNNLSCLLPVNCSSQRPLSDKTQHSQETGIHAPGGIRAHNPSKRAAADPRLRPRSNWDRLCNLIGTNISEVPSISLFIPKQLNVIYALKC